MIGTTCLVNIAEEFGRLLAEFGRISRLAEDNGLSKLLISDVKGCGLDDLNALAATSSAALTAAAVL